MGKLEVEMKYRLTVEDRDVRLDFSSKDSGFQTLDFRKRFALMESPKSAR
jgi:hypothetical protein